MQLSQGQQDALHQILEDEDIMINMRFTPAFKKVFHEKTAEAKNAAKAIVDTLAQFLRNYDDITCTSVTTYVVQMIIKDNPEMAEQFQEFGETVAEEFGHAMFKFTERVVASR